MDDPLTSVNPSKIMGQQDKELDMEKNGENEKERPNNNQIHTRAPTNDNFILFSSPFHTNQPSSYNHPSIHCAFIHHWHWHAASSSLISSSL
jgi:hypothetical protein